MQLCHLAGAQPSVHMSQFQRSHNCNVPNEGPSMKYHWWSPLLQACSNIWDYNQQANSYVQRLRSSHFNLLVHSLTTPDGAYVARSDFMVIETMMHPGIRRCEHVKYVTLVRSPMERLHSHLVFENILPTHALKTLEGLSTDEHDLLHLVRSPAPHRSPFSRFPPPNAPK